MPHSRYSTLLTIIRAGTTERAQSAGNGAPSTIATICQPVLCLCRYDVTCDSEHILGYIFNEHVLENSTDLCGAQNKCVDYVKLSYPNVTDEEWLCGHDAELNQTVVVDGHSNMHVEFYANRLEEAKGFSLAVLCYVPGFEPSVRKRQAEGEEARDSGTECVEVSDQKSAPVDSATELVSFS